MGETIAPFTDVASWLESRLEGYLEILRGWVGQNSYTWHAEGVNKLGEMTTEAFAPLGFTASTRQAATPGMGRHLCLSRPGTGGSAIALVTHLDTVYPAEEEAANDFAWRVEGERIYGPGVLDIKGGTLMILMLLEALREHEPELFAQTSWQVWADACEEVVSLDFCEWVREELVADARAVLVFEGGSGALAAPRVVSGRKGRARFDVTVKGRAAHAGADHLRGANAITEATHVVQALAALTDYERERTVNVGSIHGGGLVNRVPDNVALTAELRAHDPRLFEEGIAAVQALAGPGQVSSADGEATCRAEVTLDRVVPPWPSDASSQHLAQLWHDAGTSLQLDVGCERRGGLSDANLLWQAAPTLDGLGPHGANAHCARRSSDGTENQEYILPSSLVPLAALHVEALRRLLE